MVLALNGDAAIRVRTINEVPHKKIEPKTELDRFDDTPRIESTRPQTKYLVSGAVAGPHAIKPEQTDAGTTLKDEHLGTINQSNPALGKAGFFAADGTSPLCGITSVMNAITKLRRDWNLPSPFATEVEEQIHLMDHFLPMLGLDAHQDVVDHGTASTHFEQIARAYIRDQLNLEPAIEWIKQRPDQAPAALREAFLAGMAVAAPLSNHWILLGGPGPGDRFHVCDPNFPRPLWSEELHAVAVPNNTSLRMKKTSYVFTGFLAIGAKGEAVKSNPPIKFKTRGIEFELTTAPDGWARLELHHPSGIKTSRRAFVPPKLAQRSDRAAIDEMLKTLLGGQSPAFRELSILLQNKRIQIAQGHLIVDGRATRTLTMMELALFDEAVRTAKMRPTRGAALQPIPEELDDRDPNFWLSVTPPRSRCYGCNIGFYGGKTSGTLGAYGDYTNRVQPLIDLLRSFA